MVGNWEKSFAEVLKWEGGYVNDPLDNGGETNLGVTKAVWAEYVGRQVADGEMKTLTVDMVRPLYKRNYWDKCQCDKLPSGVDYVVFDFAVNAGCRQSVRFLQRAVGAGVDGIVGPQTLGKVAEHAADDILDSIKTQKENFYAGLVANNPSQSKFIKGWLNRVSGAHAFAEKLISP